jgi:hypothetical protein
MVSNPKEMDNITHRYTEGGYMASLINLAQSCKPYNEGTLPLQKGPKDNIPMVFYSYAIIFFKSRIVVLGAKWEVRAFTPPL